MVPVNNSDTAWLIVSDYNQDNGIFYEELREDILNPDVNNWFSLNASSYPDVGGHVGYSRDVGCNVMTNSLGFVGGFDCHFNYYRIGGGASNGVGGNASD